MIQTWTDLAALLDAHSETSRLDAQVLFAHVLGKPRSWLLAHPEAALTPQQTADLQTTVNQLLAGEPLPYILGHWEFYGLDFFVTPDVLIPRPETELLVENALRHAALKKAPTQILDVATGSGCIAIALAVQLPGVVITATDISPAVLDVARANVEKYQVADRLQFIQADLLDFEPSDDNLQPIDILTANLPYIPTGTLRRLDVYGKEPTLALDGGQDGLDLIKRLLENAGPILAEEGVILLEIEATQGKSAAALARINFPDAEISVQPDLAGHDRLLIIQT